MDSDNNPIVIANDADFSVTPDGTVTTKSMGVIARIKSVRLDAPPTVSWIGAERENDGEFPYDVDAYGSFFPSLNEFIGQPEGADSPLLRKKPRASNQNVIAAGIGRLLRIASL